MTPRRRIREETSAGGVVVRLDGERTLVLLIRDAHQAWGFPKGHVERDEGPEDAALREVREETGLANLEVIGPLDTLQWTFRSRGAHVRKSCHFFAMATPDVRTRPQRREGIVSCRWVTIDEGVRLLTHESARDMLDAARERIATFVAAHTA